MSRSGSRDDFVHRFGVVAHRGQRTAHLRKRNRARTNRIVTIDLPAGPTDARARAARCRKVLARSFSRLNASRPGVFPPGLMLYCKITFINAEYLAKPAGSIGVTNAISQYDLTYSNTRSIVRRLFEPITSGFRVRYSRSRPGMTTEIRDPPPHSRARRKPRWSPPRRAPSPRSRPAQCEPDRPWRETAWGRSRTGRCEYRTPSRARGNG